MSRVTDLLGSAPKRVKAADESPYARAIITRMLSGMDDYADATDPLADVLNDLLGLCGVTQVKCAAILTMRFGVTVTPVALGAWVNRTPGLRDRIAKSRERVERNLEAKRRALGGDGRRDWQYWLKAAARSTRRSRKSAQRYKERMWDPSYGNPRPVDSGSGNANIGE